MSQPDNSFRAIHFTHGHLFKPAPVPRNCRPPRSRLNMDQFTTTRYEASLVTDSMLEKAATLFSENYGVWGEQAKSKYTKPGNPVQMSKNRLRQQCFPDGAKCFYSTVTVGDVLAGNAFACHWIVNGMTVCWITQLVVSRDYRERGIAKTLLSTFKSENVDLYGIMSSHPAACLAAMATFGDLFHPDLKSIHRYAEIIMPASPVNYVKSAKLCGALFNPGDTSGQISSVNTEFYVDHNEPLETLARVRRRMTWELGELLDGHEFLLIIENKRRSPSR